MGEGPPFPELKDIVVRPEPPDFLFIGLVVALLLIALLLLAYFGMKWLRKTRPKQGPSPKAAQEQTLRALHALKSDAERHSTSELASKLQIIVRKYLHRAHGALGLFRTSDELLGRDTGHASPPPPPQLRAFGPVLERCDRIRYGADTTNAQGRMELVDLAIAAVEGKTEPSTPPQSQDAVA